MTHSQLRNLEPTAIAALPEDSVYSTLRHADEPMPFDLLVERVQAQRPQYSKPEIAATLARLISKRRVFLDDGKTGFVAVRQRNKGMSVLERGSR